MNRLLMKRYGGEKQNLFIFIMNTYNNEKPYYEIMPLRDSNIKKVVIFGGKVSKTINYPLNRLGSTCLYLETDEVINENNYFKNVQRLLNLIWLATDLPIDYQTEEMLGYDGFEKIYNDYKCETFYDPNIIQGQPITQNPIARVSIYNCLINKLSDKDFEKFDNALNTYIWAQEITRLPNPHLKYTLYMTLYLSSINQLANDPQPICISMRESAPHLICEKCGKKTGYTHVTSHNEEIEKLIKDLTTGNNDKIIKKVKKSYHKLRSKFLHVGLLSGGEKEGGFLFSKSSEFGILSEKQKELVEDMINIKWLNRKLLELFLQKRQIT